MSDGAENGGKTPQNRTVHHVFRHFDVGRSLTTLPYQKIPGQAGNDEESGAGGEILFL